MTKENKLLKKRSFTYLLAVFAGAALLCGAVQSARASAPDVDFTVQATSTQKAIEVGKSFKIALKSTVTPKGTHEEHLTTKNQIWYITKVAYSTDDASWTNEWSRSGHLAEAKKANFFDITISGGSGGRPHSQGGPIKVLGKLSGTLGIGDQAGFYLITFESSADVSATVNGNEESGRITSSGTAEVIAIKIDLKPVAMSTSKWPLDWGVLCLNAQTQYQQAKWQATVLPAGTTATVTSSDVKVINGSGLKNGDTFTVQGKSNESPGKYTLTITSDQASSVESTGKGIAFKILGRIVSSAHPYAGTSIHVFATQASNTSYIPMEGVPPGIIKGGNNHTVHGTKQLKTRNQEIIGVNYDVEGDLDNGNGPGDVGVQAETGGGYNLSGISDSIIYYNGIPGVLKTGYSTKQTANIEFYTKPANVNIRPMATSIDFDILRGSIKYQVLATDAHSSGSGLGIGISIGVLSISYTAGDSVWATAGIQYEYDYQDPSGNWVNYNGNFPAGYKVKVQTSGSLIWGRDTDTDSNTISVPPFNQTLGSKVSPFVINGATSGGVYAFAIATESSRNDGQSRAYSSAVATERPTIKINRIHIFP